MKGALAEREHTILFREAAQALLENGFDGEGLRYNWPTLADDMDAIEEEDRR